MSSEKHVAGYLRDEDWKLWKIAVRKYKIGQSKLLKEIVHSWLFSNKLSLEEK